jgi:hypothetical protein
MFWDAIARTPADVGGVAGPVAFCGDVLPLDGDFDVDTDYAGPDGGGEFGGELEQCDGSGLGLTVSLTARVR